MNRKDIYTLISMLGIIKYKDHDEWVTISCPFSKWTHQSRKDEHPSFGIHVGNPSKYHCFSCGKKGDVSLLPINLSHYTGEQRPDLTEFIFKHESTDMGEYEETAKAKTAPAISLDVLNIFNSLKVGTRKLTNESIFTWNLKEDNGRLIIPIFDVDNRLISIKGRSLNGGFPKYLIYTQYAKQDAKVFGIWFGMHFPIVPNKALIITEGEIDAILLKQFGCRNVWSSMGASISKTQLLRITNITVPLILFTDNDEAGIRLKNKLKMAVKGVVDLYEVKNYFGCKDASELFEKGLLTKALKSIDKLI